MGQKASVAASNTDVPDTKRKLLAPIGLFVFGVLLYITVYGYQSGAIVRDTPFRYREITPFTDGPDPLMLDVAYPQTLWLDQTDVGSQTVTFALWYTAPPVRTQPYTVSFTLPMAVVIVTDIEDNPIVPKFVITPTVQSVSPVVFRIRRTLLPEGEPPRITPIVRVHSPSGIDLSVPEGDLEPITLQSRFSARCSHFWSLVFGPTTQLLAVAAGLVALAREEIRRWQSEQIEARRKSMQQEAESRAREERHQQVIEAALTEIRSWRALLQTDISEGARRYVDYLARPDPMWQDETVRAMLQKTWQENAPAELERTVELVGHPVDESRFYQIVELFGVEESVKTLEWAVEQLDDEWRQKASNGISLLGQRPEYRQYITGAVLQAIEQRPWRAILQAWPHISLWRGFSPATDPEVASGLRYLGLENNPFGSGRAETDTLLLTCHVDLPWLEKLRQPQPTLLVGAAGSGKTATALLLAYDALRDLRVRHTFPVYYPATPGAPELGDLARVLARTLLHYLAVTPAAFLRHGIAGKVAIAHLLALYARPNLALRFHQAGLPQTGDGARMIQEIEGLIQSDPFQEPSTDDELLAPLSEARPRGFQYTTMLLDVQEQTGAGEDTAPDRYLRSLLDLSDALARVGVFVKAFLPDTLQESLRRQDSQLPVELIQLRWSNDELSRLLENCLKQSGDETLAAWCDPREGDLSPDSRLVSAAQGAPGGLIRKGNELLRRIGQEQRRLKAGDLDDILGSLPQPDETES